MHPQKNGGIDTACYPGSKQTVEKDAKRQKQIATMANLAEPETQWTQ
ncbi:MULTISPECIES: hypothetical protein [unclassified Herbaspirillum]|nr:MULTISPECIES: hypothetical protein [unclassified Herbaspirillum]MBB5391883.1 hypothetical protein [Herbaspirillum sp. SJZ102]